jgi:predicted nucleic acid-binding protein
LVIRRYAVADIRSNSGPRSVRADASYFALAETLDAVLLTADRRLVRAVDVLCEVDVLR